MLISRLDDLAVKQIDYLVALHAGHGEFPRAILAPATAEEAFHAIIKAFNLAE